MLFVYFQQSFVSFFLTRRNTTEAKLILWEAQAAVRWQLHSIHKCSCFCEKSQRSQGTVQAELDFPVSETPVLSDSWRCKGYRLSCTEVWPNSTGLSGLGAQMIKVWLQKSLWTGFKVLPHMSLQLLFTFGGVQHWRTVL